MRPKDESAALSQGDAERFGESACRRQNFWRARLTRASRMMYRSLDFGQVIPYLRHGLSMSAKGGASLRPLEAHVVGTVTCPKQPTT